MTNELPRRRHPLWFMLTLAVVACGAVAAYRYRHPALTTTRAIVQVPSATDIGNLCLRPEVTTAAVAQLEAAGDLYLTLEQTQNGSKLSGMLTATKLKSTAQIPGTGSNETTSNEKWELTYRTERPERALIELTALIEVLRTQVTPAAHESTTADHQITERLTELTAKHQSLQAESQQMSGESPLDQSDASQVSAVRDRVQTLHRALAEARVLRLRAEDECRLVEQEVHSQQRLDAIATKLTQGPVQEAVLEIERQRKLSAELTRLNEAERKLGMVYGDKHPKLIELRQKFETLLTELGGWDQILDASHVVERVQSSLGQVLDLQQQHEAALQTQIELEESAVIASAEAVERRTALTAQLKQVEQELDGARKAQQAAESARTARWSVSQPAEVVDPHWTTSLAAWMAVAAAAGLGLGWVLNRAISPASGRYEERYDELPESAPVPSATIPPPEAQLDLAQRRALRQARLQQVYAA